MTVTADKSIIRQFLATLTGDQNLAFGDNRGCKIQDQRIFPRLLTLVDERQGDTGSNDDSLPLLAACLEVLVPPGPITLEYHQLQYKPIRWHEG